MIEPKPLARGHVHAYAWRGQRHKLRPLRQLRRAHQLDRRVEVGLEGRGRDACLAQLELGDDAAQRCALDLHAGAGRRAAASAAAAGRRAGERMLAAQAHDSPGERARLELGGCLSDGEIGGEQLEGRLTNVRKACRPYVAARAQCGDTRTRLSTIAGSAGGARARARTPDSHEADPFAARGGGGSGSIAPPQHPPSAGGGNEHVPFAEQHSILRRGVECTSDDTATQGVRVWLCT